MATYLISDLHLSPQTPQLIEGFVYFLNEIANEADSLYILGDFFDAWIGDDDDSDFAAQVKIHLKTYASKIDTYFICGNRDFLIGKAFAEECGITLLGDKELIELGGKQVLLMHGDTLCTEDTEYMQFRAMVRNPQWQQQVLSLPLPQRRQMAADLRSKSQSLNAMKAEDIMDVTESEVAREVNEYKADLLIHGHTHRPGTNDIEGSDVKRMVLGDWGKQGWYIKSDATGFNLISFDIPQ